VNSRLAKAALLAMAAGLLVGCGSTRTVYMPAPSTPASSAPSTPAPSAPSSSSPAAPAGSDITVSCSSCDDPLGEGALGSGPTALVTLGTNDFVNASEIDVTVIDFDQNGNQVGTDTIKFSGPFAAGQTFKGEPDSTNGNTYSCEVASVSSGASVTYTNANPVG